MATPQTQTYQTKSGPVVAAVHDDLVAAHGVPFAQAKRFAAPQAAEAWTEPRDCTKPGALCPQLPFRLEFVLGDVDKNRDFSEDCLLLTVVVPAQSKVSGKLPVIVWYHGGANIAGGADIDIMDPSYLAREDVIVVSPQYRLGVFGCLEVEGIIPANLHVLDQIASLRWVHENIEAFGGDPAQVTIMGQSAGGVAVYNLLFADGTEHMYQRAILMSAPLGIIHSSGKDAALTAKRTHELLGSAATAAEKSTAEILGIQQTIIEEQRARGGTIGFWPAWGKHPLPKVDDINARIEHLAKQKDLLIGWTADDCMPFVQMSPYGGKIFGLPLVGSTIQYTANKIATNYVFKKGSQDLSRSWAKAGGKSTTYCFEWFPAGSPLRACHCIDMPFIFGNWETWKRAPLVAGPESKEVVERVGPHVRNVFMQFAKKGLPSGRHMAIDARFSADGWV